MPILIIVTLWLLCILLLVFLLCSFYKALCRVSPTNRTATTAASATTAIFATASVEDGAAASRDVLSRLPVFAYSSAAQKKQLLSCLVCLADFKEGERGRFLPRCFHCYHVECIDEWLASHSACPVCRASIDAKAAQPPV